MLVVCVLVLVIGWCLVVDMGAIYAVLCFSLVRCCAVCFGALLVLGRVLRLLVTWLCWFCRCACYFAYFVVASFSGSLVSLLVFAAMLRLLLRVAWCVVLSVWV